jgi:hypothetical protein
MRMRGIQVSRFVRKGLRVVFTLGGSQTPDTTRFPA